MSHPPCQQWWWLALMSAHKFTFQRTVVSRLRWAAGGGGQQMRARVVSYSSVDRQRRLVGLTICIRVSMGLLSARVCVCVGKRPDKCGNSNPATRPRTHTLNQGSSDQREFTLNNGQHSQDEDDDQFIKSWRQQQARKHRRTNLPPFQTSM